GALAPGVAQAVISAAVAAAASAALNPGVIARPVLEERADQTKSRSRSIHPGQGSGDSRRRPCVGRLLQPDACGRRNPHRTPKESSRSARIRTLALAALAGLTLAACQAAGAPAEPPTSPRTPVAEGGMCGGFAGFACAEGLYCQMTPEMQKIADGSGT